MSNPSKNETARIEIPLALKHKLASMGKKAFKKTGTVEPIPKPVTAPAPLPSAHPSASKIQRKGTPLYQELLQNVYDAVVITEQDGTIVDANLRALESLCYEQAEICSLGISTVISGFDQALLNTVMQNLENERFTLIQAYSVQKNGAIFPCEIVVNRLHLTQAGELCFFIRDVTQRKNAENLLKTELNALHNSASGIAIADMEGKLQFCNPAFLKLWKFAEPAEAVGMDTRQLWRNPESVNSILESIQGGLPWMGELVALRKDRTEFFTQISAAGNLDSDNNLVGIVFSFVDITEQKRIHEAMLHTQKLEGLGLLAGGIAHDFNNLLAVIMGNAELARMNLHPHAEGTSYLENIEMAGKRGADLCKQMLAYAGRGTFVLNVLNINTLLKEITDLISVSLPKSVVLKYELADNLPLVEVDPTQIRQVLMNLVVNASEAMDKKGGEIIISSSLMKATRADLNACNIGENLKEGDYVCLEVADNGCGMDQETLLKIFDPFFSTKFTGRGLGLSAVAGIAQTHKAALKVTSQPKAGTSFKFMLPCVNSSIMASPSPKRISASFKFEGLALVIDDEENLREVATKMLEEFGFTSLQAPDGIEGLDRFREHEDKINLVMLDMTMPHMNGEEVFEEIRKINSHVGIVIMSGYSAEEMSEKFSGKDRVGFLQKPFNLDELRIIAELLVSDGR